MAWLQSVLVAVVVFIGSLFGLDHARSSIPTFPAPAVATTDAASTNPRTDSPHSSSSSPASGNSLVPHGAPATTTPETWKTYTNEAYGFSIRYPCDSECNDYPISDTQAYGTSAAVLPTQSGAQLTVITFTDQSVASWNTTPTNDPSGMTQEFPFIPDSLRIALQLPVNSPCTVIWADGVTTPSGCRIVDIAVHKAVEIAGYTRYDGTYYLNLKGNQWLELEPDYNDYYVHPASYDRGYNWPAYLAHTVTPPATLQIQIDAVSKVLSTLQVRPQ